MTDVRLQLTEALDRAESVARAARGGHLGRWHINHPGWPECTDGTCDCCRIEGGLTIYDEGGHDRAIAEHMCAWDPTAVLRLIERDRKLLAEYDKAAEEATGIRWSLVGESRRLAFEQQVRWAAEFWLGTKEGQSNG